MSRPRAAGVESFGDHPSPDWSFTVRHRACGPEAQQRKEAEERVRAIEKRRERALVARYPDKATHDIERNAAC